MILQDKRANRVLWWAVFALATYGLSLFFHCFKAFTLNPSWEHGAALGGVVALLALTVTVLAYDGYASDKAHGKIVHAFGPFEWLYQQQSARRQRTQATGEALRS